MVLVVKSALLVIGFEQLCRLPVHLAEAEKRGVYFSCFVEQDAGGPNKEEKVDQKAVEVEKRRTTTTTRRGACREFLEGSSSCRSHCSLAHAGRRDRHPRGGGRGGVEDFQIRIFNFNFLTSKKCKTETSTARQRT